MTKTTRQRNSKGQLLPVIGYILYEGPSLLDGGPIVVIANGLSSKNRKTGKMIQTYILRADLSPCNAKSCGASVSVCGTCPMQGEVIDNTHARWIEHRGKTNDRLTCKGRQRIDSACYVNVGQGPNITYGAYKRGRYERFDPNNAKHAAHFQGRNIRFGAYGDPAAVPVAVWDTLAGLSASTTGYTHQHDRAGSLAYQRHCMASCHTKAKAEQLQGQGWKTFRTELDATRTPHVEAFCPAYQTAGRIKCNDCGMCKGSNAKRSVVVPAHGSPAQMAVYRKLVTLGVAE